jgi:hypothetical protein
MNKWVQESESMCRVTLNKYCKICLRRKTQKRAQDLRFNRIKRLLLLGPRKGPRKPSARLIVTGAQRGSSKPKRGLREPNIKPHPLSHTAQVCFYTFFSPNRGVLLILPPLKLTNTKLGIEVPPVSNSVAY